MLKHRQYTYFYIFSRATLNETFTAKYDGVLLRTPQVRPKSEIYTPKRDDEHPHPFHMRSSPPSGWTTPPTIPRSTPPHPRVTRCFLSTRMHYLFDIKSNMPKIFAMTFESLMRKHFSTLDVCTFKARVKINHTR